jgi:CubicO group peptidase (beta-lactamase class C family)
MLSLLVATLTAACPTGVTWPGDEWPSKVEETKASKAAAIAALEEYAFTLIGKDEERKGIRTDGLVIIKGGQLIYERYARGFTESKRHITWSVTKSISAALVGRAVALGKLNIDDGICKYVDSDAEEFCSRLTVKHFLEFSTGLDWNEIYENESNQRSSVLAKLYGEGRLDYVKFMARHRFRDDPGTTYCYSTGDSSVVAAAARGALEKDYGRAWDRDVLYTPIGMKSALMERDSTGTPAGGSFFYATPRDMARFGYLYLRDGCWAGERLLPEGWVQASQQISFGFKNKPIDRDNKEVYGWQMWLNRRVPEVGQTDLPFPDVPDDAFMPRGHWGQYIMVIPSLDLVITRTGDDRDKTQLDLNTLFKLAIEVAR